MPIGSVFSIQAISCGTSGANIFSQVTSAQLENGFNLFKVGGSGKINDAMATILEGRPMLNFSTTELATVLDPAGANIGISGKAVASGTPLKASFRQRSAKGTYLTTAHEQISVANGLIVPTRIQLAQFREATIDLSTYVCFDETNGPFGHAQVADAGLSALATSGEVFTLGKVVINGTAISLVQDVSIDFGIEVEMTPGQGHIWPLEAFIKKRRPVITINALDVAQARTLLGGALGTGFLHAGGGDVTVTVHARRKVAYGGNVAAGGDNQIAISATRCMWQVNTISGDDMANATMSIELTPLEDGSANPLLVISVTSDGI